jgi:hypothetical protein
MSPADRVSEAWVVPSIDAAAAPLVSILIPSHRPELLTEALASVWAQTVDRSQYEVLINSAADWYTNKINAIAQIARGKYLCVLCDDDLLAPTHLERCLALTRGNFDIIYTDIQFFGDRDDVYELPSFGLNTFRHAACPWMSGALVKRSLWNEIGGHRAGIILQDTAFWIECALRGADAAHVREPLTLARQHGTQGAKMIDKSRAALELQSLYPDIFPSPFVTPVDPAAPKDGRGIVPRVFFPPHLLESDTRQSFHRFGTETQ